MPLDCDDVPAPIGPRSSTTTSRAPKAARWYAIEVPITPAPITIASCPIRRVPLPDDPDRGCPSIPISHSRLPGLLQLARGGARLAEKTPAPSEIMTQAS